MNPIRTLIVDDEPLARASLRRLVGRSPHLERVGEAGDGSEALRLIESLLPDLVFLDIRMPGMSGLELVRRLHYRPHIIFTTAFEEFAVAAFELQALDYLLKPFGRRRFEQAVTRLIPDDSTTSLRIDQALRPDTPLTQIFVKGRGHIHPVSVSDVLMVCAADDYACLVTAGKRHLVSVRMKTLEARLPGARFVRIHRSTIVNLDFIESIESAGSGRYGLTLQNGAEVTTSRSGAARLRAAMSGQARLSRL